MDAHPDVTAAVGAAKKAIDNNVHVDWRAGAVFATAIFERHLGLIAPRPSLVDDPAAVERAAKAINAMEASCAGMASPFELAAAALKAAEGREGEG